MMKSHRNEADHKGFWAMVYVLGGAVGILLTASVLYFAGWISYRQAVQFAVHLWGPYLITALGVGWVATRFPLEEGRWMDHLWVHILAMIGFIIATESLQLLLALSMSGPEGLANPPIPFSPTMLPEPGGASQPPWIPPNGFGNQPGLPILRGVWIRGLSDVPIYGLIVSVVQVARSSAAIRERDEQHARLQAAFVQTRLHALQRQLQPHFLFNTLNSISALIHTQPTMADQMLGDLSELLRSALEQEQQPETPLSQEIELLDHYLGIQSVRFGGQLRTVRNFAPETLELLVPTFIFQPLVENAIIHGIGIRTEGGTIWVESQLVGERLLLRVIDDGKGAPSHHKSGIIEGIGLQNTRSRMETLYGSTASLRVGNRQSGGFLVELELPARKSGTPANSTRNLTKDSSTHESATR